MTVRAYKGSCHCGAVRYEADIDLAAGTTKCNCTFCTKIRNWSAIIKPEAFRLLAGHEALSDYQFGDVGHHLFCRHCGVRGFTRGYHDFLGGAFYSVYLCCLDDLDPSDWATAPLRYADGRNDDWGHEPAERRHL